MQEEIKMETSQLLTFAHIASITYDDPKASKIKFKSFGFSIVEFFDIEGAQAYLLKDMNGMHVLSFRGTEVSEPSDVLADLKAGKNVEAIGGKIHVGFKGEINKLWPSIEKAVANIDSLHVTGHSLGAAMATIAAGRMQSKVTALVTFGSPRVGNKEYVKCLTVTHYRVQNNCDDVTKVPFRLMGFDHHGTHRYMNFHGEFRDLTPWQRVKDMALSRLRARAKGQKYIGVFDHMMANYIAKLQKLGE
jgi:triacylglycerol lipase